jgi:ring-1,2-phenylacetyl-CoA epoxidase subunit PaaB
MTETNLNDALPKATLAVYEVFRQEESGGPMVHAGQIEAPDDGLAYDYAREGYSRRGEATRLWVVRRDAVTEISDHDFLDPPLDRSYRSGKAYRVAVGKRRALRESLSGAAASLSSADEEVSP